MPSPTTLGGSTAVAPIGPVAPQRGKAAYVITAIAIVLTAVAAIIFVANRGKTPDVANGSGSAVDDRGGHKVAAGVTDGSGGAGSSSAGSPTNGTSGASGSAGQTGPVVVAADAGSSSATGSALRDPGGSNTTGAASVNATGSGSGSDGSPVEPAVENVQVVVRSTPRGAKIWVDDADTGQATPATLTFPREKGKRIQITLRYRGYETYAFKQVDTGASSNQEADLVKIKPVSPPASCRTPQRSGCPRDPKGCCVPEATGSGGRTNGSGNKPNPQGRGSSADPDELMRP
jgi:hypothetical protein